MFMKSHKAFWYTELGSTLVFIIDYLLRWGTADIRNNNRKTAFLAYPFSVMAIIDLLSILPAVTLLNPAFKLFRFVRLLRLTRVLKMLGISSKVRLFVSILYKERQVLSSVLVLSLLYIFITALLLFNVEPHGYRNSYHGRIWRYVSRYRRRALRKHAFIVVWHSYNCFAFRRDNRPLSRRTAKRAG